jgi:hypothetical protein
MIKVKINGVKLGENFLKYDLFYENCSRKEYEKA